MTCCRRNGRRARPAQVLAEHVDDFDELTKHVEGWLRRGQKSVIVLAEIRQQVRQTVRVEPLLEPVRH